MNGVQKKLKSRTIPSRDCGRPGAEISMCRVLCGRWEGEESYAGCRLPQKALRVKELELC